MGFTLIHHPDLGPDGKGATVPAHVTAVADYQTKGWHAVDLSDVRLTPSDFDDDLAAAAGDPVNDVPKKNASHEAWQNYAITHGLEPEAVAEMSRNELVAHFTDETAEV